MTLRKSVTVVLVIVAVVTLGVLAGPRLMHRSAEAPAVTPAPTASEAAPSTEAAPRAARPSSPRAESTHVPEVAATAPELQKALKPLLSYGTNLDKAADGFQSGVQFAAVAHAAKNTDVPFMVLKHRVLNEKKSLAVAIHESKPELNAKREATKAWDEARQELSEL
jgi:hypothetical protein